MVYTKADKYPMIIQSKPGSPTGTSYQKPHVDLGRIDINEFLNYIGDRFTEKSDRGIFLNFFQTLGLRVQKRKIDALHDVVKSIWSINQTVTQFQAELWQRQVIFQCIIESKEQEARNAIEKMKADHALEIQRIKNEALRDQETIRTQKLYNEDIQIILDFKRTFFSKLDTKNMTAYEFEMVRIFSSSQPNTKDVLSAIAQYKKAEAEAEKEGQEARASKITTDKMESDFQELKKKRENIQRND